jgi:hypothetical protein
MLVYNIKRSINILASDLIAKLKNGTPHKAKLVLSYNELF